MALTAVTAGKGFGLNRAVLLLVDKERQNLRGYFAVGPRSPQEAARILALSLNYSRLGQRVLAGKADSATTGSVALTLDEPNVPDAMPSELSLRDRWMIGPLASR